MKRRIMSVVILAAVLTVCACKETNKNITNEVNQTDKTEHREKGYLFEAKEITMSVDEEANKYFIKLGEPEAYFEAKSCAFDDTDKIYTYSGFEITTYTINEKEYVLSIVLLNDTVKTKEGISIGSDALKVEEVYGTPKKSTKTWKTYEKDGMTLRFIIEDGKVYSIEYLSNVV